MMATTRRDCLDRESPYAHLDVVLIGAVAAVAVLGLVMVFSTTRGTGAEPNTYFVVRQSVFTVGGVGALVAAMSVDYRRLRDWAVPFYGLAMALLVAVVTPLGQERKGTQAWFELFSLQFQPSEAAKVVLILAMAAFLSVEEGALGGTRLLGAMVVIGVPSALIMLQPDLGTVLVFIVLGMGLATVAGADPRHLALIGLVGLVTTLGVLTSDVLQEYQRDRLTSFIGDSGDLQGAQYNVRQSQIAVGSGGISGQGLFDGPQTQNGFVPEQQTDFIFTAVGEELGFIGAAALLGLFGLIALRIFRAAQLAADRFGALICIGVLIVLVFQIFQNVGMTMGIMPITGIPLPFMSYGGSSTVTEFAAIGLVLNVHMRRFA